MAIDANGPTWRQLVQGALATKGTAIARGEVLVTTLNALGAHIGIGSEAPMAWAFVTLTALAVRVACL